MTEVRGHVPENELFRYRRLRTIRDHLDIAASMLLTSHRYTEAYRNTSFAKEFIEAEMLKMRVIFEPEEALEDGQE